MIENQVAKNKFTHAALVCPASRCTSPSSRLRAHTGGGSSFSPSGVKYHSFAFREEVAVQISARFTDTSSTSTATLASPGQVEHMHSGTTIRGQLIAAPHDLRVPVENSPPGLRDLLSPQLVRGAQSGLSGAEQLRRGVHNVPEIHQESPHRPRGDVFVAVKLRRRGPGGRERRFERPRR